MPKKMLQAAFSPETRGPRRFPRTVDRFSLLVFENFYFGRNILNIVALEGLPRFIRPKSLFRWSRHLHSLGFSVAPVTQRMHERGDELVRTFPHGFSLNRSHDAMSLAWCGRPITHVSLWTA